MNLLETHVGPEAPYPTGPDDIKGKKSISLVEN